DQIVSAPSSRAIGAIAAGSSVPSWIRSSSAYSRSIAAGDPSGSRSRVTSGVSVSPGNGWSTVNPQRYAPNSTPGTISTRPSSPSSAAAASRQASGGSASRSSAGSTTTPLQSPGTLPSTSAPIPSATTRTPRGRGVASTSAAAASASPRNIT